MLFITVSHQFSYFSFLAQLEEHLKDEIDGNTYRK